MNEQSSFLKRKKIKEKTRELTISSETAKQIFNDITFDQQSSTDEVYQSQCILQGSKITWHILKSSHFSSWEY